MKPDERPPKTNYVKILHFDDEPGTVLSIPNSIYNRYITYRKNWLVGDQTEYDVFVRKFVLMPSPDERFEIQYYLVDEPEYRRLLQEIELHLTHVIGIFDLTRVNENRIELAGQDLFQEVQRVLHVPMERLFVLTGFPAFMPAFVHPSQRNIKPVASTEFARQITNVMPHAIRIKE